MVLFVWTAESKAGRIINKDRPRRANLHHDVPDSPDNQSENTQCLNAISEETNGLVTIRSEGCQHRQVYCLLHQFTGQASSEIVFNTMVISRSAREREMSRGNTADHASLRQSFQGGPRKDNFRVTARMGSKGRFVIHHEIRRVWLGRNRPIGRVAGRDFL